MLCAQPFFRFMMAAFLLFGALSGCSDEIATIGVLQFGRNNLDTLQAFKKNMAEHGYVEGENIRYVFDGPAANLDDLVPCMERLLSQKPNLVFASTTPAAKTAIALAAPLGLPVVFAPVNDPAASGVVADPRRPEGVATGVMLAPSEGRRLQSLLQLAPGIRRVYLPYNPADPSAAASLAQALEAAPRLGVELVVEPFTAAMDAGGHPSGMEEIEAAAPKDVDAVFLPREGLVMSRILDFIAFCEKRRLPLSTPRLEQVRMGALTGYGFVGEAIGIQAARLARRILGGAKIADLPVETAQDFIFLNMAAAEAIGLDVPDAFLRRVNTVFYGHD